MFENLKIKRELKKSINKTRKEYNAMPFLVPYTVNLEKWLERYQGDASRLDWLISEMLDYAEEIESAGDCMYIHFDDNGAVSFRLDEIGVFWFSDILQEFFSPEEVKQMQEYLKLENAIVRFYQDLQTAISGMNTNSLKEYRHKWEYVQDSSDTAQEIKQNIFKLIDAELRIRKD